MNKQEHKPTQKPLLPAIPPSPVPDSVAVVVLSGGQDSVTCLGWALKCFESVYAIGFRYGQKHAVEIQQAEAICHKHMVPYTFLEVNSLASIGDSALVTEDGNVKANHHRLKNLPASFVPNRNAMFLTLAHAYAQKIGAQHVVTGVCQTDYSGYPDCRSIFIQDFAAALNKGSQSTISILTPLMYLTKAETFLLAERCGILDTVLEDSHTCYLGDRETRHAWGAGCGDCPACQLRAKGYEEYLALKESLSTSV